MLQERKEIMLDIIKAIILGIIQGITEWLPISSTGHMILFNEFTSMNITEEFKSLFFVVIQLGSIMAVVVLFWDKLIPFLSSKGKKERFETYNMWFKVAVASIPAVVVGYFFDRYVDGFYNHKTVAISLIVYGVVFILIENMKKRERVSTINDISYKMAFIIGVFQVLALIPGTSRSGSTIIGALTLGASRTVASEFTFFLAIPIMFGASFLKILKYGLIFSTTEVLILIVGCAVAFLVSLLVISFFMCFIKKNDFKVFGYYRIVLGTLILAYFATR